MGLLSTLFFCRRVLQGPALTTRQFASIDGELPLVGLGSWITINVGKDAKLLNESTKVISAFLEGGGRMIDSSQMNGSAQAPSVMHKTNWANQSQFSLQIRSTRRPNQMDRHKWRRRKGAGVSTRRI